MGSIITPLVFSAALFFFGYKDYQLVRAQSEFDSPRRKINKWYWILAVGMLGWSFIQYRNDQQDKAWAAYYKAYPPSAEKIREGKIKKVFDSYDGSHPGLVNAVKNSMNDPSSFDHVETGYTDNGSGSTITVSMKFRGKNAFNATILNRAEGKVNINNGALQSWSIIK